MGRGKRQRGQSQSDREALAVFANFVSGGTPSRPLETPIATAGLKQALAVLDPEGRVRVEERGRWFYFKAAEKKGYPVVGKYLYFSSQPERLLPVVAAALNERGFHHAKISRYLGQWPKHVLCVYYQDPSRLEEMEALAAELGLEYGGWKTDAQTRAEARASAR